MCIRDSYEGRSYFVARSRLSSSRLASRGFLPGNADERIVSSETGGPHPKNRRPRPQGVAGIVGIDEFGGGLRKNSRAHGLSSKAERHSFTKAISPTVGFGVGGRRRLNTPTGGAVNWGGTPWHEWPRRRSCTW